MKKFFEKYLKWIVFAVSLIGLISVIKDIMDKGILTIDIDGYNTILKILMSDVMTNIFRVLTNLGGTVWLIVLAIILVISIKNRKIGLSIALNLSLAALTNHTLKNILQRPRPPVENRLIAETGYSLPSGHSMVSFAFYGFLIYVIYRYIKNKYIKWSLIIFLIILILTIGISRIYLGVHYVSDVISGYLLALSYLIIYITLAKKFIIKEK